MLVSLLFHPTFVHLIIIKSAAANPYCVAFAAGAGQIGNYSNVSFTSRGTGNFTPSKSANPAIGTPGLPEQVDEVRIEITAVGKEVVKDAVERVRKAHPYEEVVVDVYRLEEF